MCDLCAFVFACHVSPTRNGVRGRSGPCPPGIPPIEEGRRAFFAVVGVAYLPEERRLVIEGMVKGHRVALVDRHFRQGKGTWGFARKRSGQGHRFVKKCIGWY